MSTVLIAGCGDVGTRLGLRLVAAGHRVLGLRRDPCGLPDTFHHVAADLGDAATLANLPVGIDAVAYTAAADGRDESAYRAAYVDGLHGLLTHLGNRSEDVRRVVFTASTAVYGTDDGSWVDEDTPTAPDRFSGRILVDAEELLRASAYATSSLRVAGIYGPGRTRLIDRVRNGQEAVVPGGARWTNRVHADDVASALHHVLDLEVAAPTYLVVDDEPADRNDVIRWLADQLGVTVGENPEADVSQRGGNKRCSNERLRTSGWAPAYPTYREGYAALLS